MKFERTQVWGFEHAFRGMRNPKNSWHLSDSHFDHGTECHFSEDDGPAICPDCEYFEGNGLPCKPLLGPKDLKLAQTLIKGGSEHRKFLRQIFVSVDITAPTYWWSEYDTYKVGTTANSTSTMHKIMSQHFIPDMFECEGMRGYKLEVPQRPNEIDEDFEEWLPYPADTHYLVSNQGRIKHLSTTAHGKSTKERIISGSLHEDGYIFVSIICGESRYKQIPKHRIIAETWLANPDCKPEINHKDGNKLNNAVENLEWVTLSENQVHAAEYGLQPRKASTYKGKLSAEERDEILTRYAVDDISARELAREYGVSHTTINALLHNKYNYGEGYDNEYQTFLKLLDELNELRDEWLITKEKKVWKTLIEKLPRNWLQMRTVTLTYENLYAIIHQRSDHKLNEWSGKDDATQPHFIAWAHTLPYAEELLFFKEPAQRQRAEVFCISGKAGSGKDTAAELIRYYLWGEGKRVLITHYADLLKYMCKQFFGWNGEKDEQGRALLQHVGTDLVRAQDPNFWVDFIVRALKAAPDRWDYVIIPDCRFPNELSRLREAGFHVTHIHVQREGYESVLTQGQQSHPSETAMRDVTADYVFHNQGTIADLMADVLDMFKKILKMRGENYDCSDSKERWKNRAVL